MGKTRHKNPWIYGHFYSAVQSAFNTHSLTTEILRAITYTVSKMRHIWLTVTSAYTSAAISINLRISTKRILKIINISLEAWPIAIDAVLRRYRQLYRHRISQKIINILTVHRVQTFANFHNSCHKY